LIFEIPKDIEVPFLFPALSLTDFYGQAFPDITPCFHGYGKSLPKEVAKTLQWVQKG